MKDAVYHRKVKYEDPSGDVKGKDAFDIPKNRVTLQPGQNPIPGGESKVKMDENGKPYVLAKRKSGKAKRAW